MTQSGTPTEPVRSPAATGRWFTPTEPSRASRLRLFLLPHAGSGAVAFRTWPRMLPAGIGVQALTLPGRLGRRAEPLPSDWDTLVDQLYGALLSSVDDRPYALFGHCIGAQLAYRLAVRLADDGLAPPALLGLSGWAPRGFFQPPEGHERMSAAELRQWVLDLGAVPAEVSADPDMLDLVLPPVIADFRLSAQYRDDAAAVDCPLVTYGGRSDPLLEPAAMASWTGRSSRFLGHTDYPGDHFYVYQHTAAVLWDFVRHLVRQARSTA